MILMSSTTGTTGRNSNVTVDSLLNYNNKNNYHHYNYTGNHTDQIQPERDRRGDIPDSSSSNSTSGWSRSGNLLPIPSTTVLTHQEQRIAYFKTHYDVMTGVRIAATLGGFFLMVLLTLLYKSKCKKISPLPTPSLSMEQIRLEHDLVMDPDLGHHGSYGNSFHDHTQINSTVIDQIGSDCGDRPDLLTFSPLLHLSESSTIESIDNFHGGRQKLKCQKAENLKFMDDTSSENLPTRGSDEDDECPSIGSDSVFTYGGYGYDERRKMSSVSAYTGLEDEDDNNCGITLSQATAQVHHRDSFCSSEIESDYLENHNNNNNNNSYRQGRRRSSTATQTFSNLRSSTIRRIDQIQYPQSSTIKSTNTTSSSHRYHHIVLSPPIPPLPPSPPSPSSSSSSEQINTSPLLSLHPLRDTSVLKINTTTITMIPKVGNIIPPTPPPPSSLSFSDLSIQPSTKTMDSLSPPSPT